jgi:hypothetical protein
MTCLSRGVSDEATRPRHWKHSLFRIGVGEIEIGWEWPLQAPKTGPLFQKPNAGDFHLQRTPILGLQRFCYRTEIFFLPWRIERIVEHNGWMHPARLPVEQLLTQCSLQRTRRSGPGGQHRNKVETAIVIVHEPTGIRAEASERRRQSENRTQALFRLRVRLALGVRYVNSKGVNSKGANSKGGASTPSELWLQRSSGGRIKVNSRHEDFPALLAEALDAIAVAKSDVAAAAQRLGVTSSQLIKLLKLQPEAFVGVNQQRTDHGLSILR